MDEEAIREEIAMLAAMLASEASPHEAALVLRAMADEIEEAQPGVN